MSAGFFTLILLVVFIAAILATFATFGFTAMFLAILALFIPLPQAVAITGIVDFTNGLARGWFFKAQIDWKLVLWYGIPGIITSIIASFLVAQIDTKILERIIGLTLLIYGLYKLAAANKAVAFTPRYSTLIAGGLLTGTLAGLVGAGGALRSAFLSSYALPVKQFIATVTLIEIMVDLGRTSGYVSTIQLSSQEWSLIILSIPISFLGVWFASKYAKRLSEKHFSILLSCFLILFGIKYFLF